MRPIAALVADLIFGSKIRATADALAIEVRMLRSFDEVRAVSADAAAIILDLTAGEGDHAELVRELKALRPGLPVLGFLPHVELELAKRVREAGADRVLPRSKFNADLAKILGELGRE